MKLEDYIREWLIGQRRRMRTQRYLRAAGALALSFFIFFCTFWFFYYFVDLIVGHFWGPSVKLSLLITAGLFVIQLIASVWVRPEHLKQELQESDRNEVFASNRMEVRIINILISYGPHLFLETFRLLGEAGRLRTLDVEGCAPVLAVLAKADARLAYAEILPVIPAGHDSNDVMDHLRFLDGVLFLKSEPPGLSLTKAFRKDLRALRPRKTE